jgi:death-on-curing protein
MEIQLDYHTIMFLYSILVDLYKDTEDPITLGHSEGMVQVCVEKPFVDIYNFIPFPHTLHKASVLLESIINFHPFADGNKRVALLSMFFFLYWNGYDFHIPEDADAFTVEVAERKHDLNSIFLWINKYTKRTFGSALRHFLISSYFSLEEPRPSALFQFFIPIILTAYPFMYFGYTYRKKTKAKSH